VDRAHFQGESGRRTFEFRDDKSAKFWCIDLQGRSFTVWFGKLGAAGQTQTKDFADEAKAKKEYDKLVAEKVKKGYVEVGAAAAPAAPAAHTGTAKAAAKTPKAAAGKKGTRARQRQKPSPTPSAPARGTTGC
jgi:predicted DNA-binding WGR domain protein